MSLQQSRTKIVHSEDGTDTIAAQGGLMAPSIRYHNGTFYIVCTNVSHNHDDFSLPNDYQNFILSTTNIWSNEWSDPVFYDFYGIDTSLFWDDDGRSYLIGAASPAPASKIKQFEIDVKTGEKLSEEVLLWEGITKVFPEGPHMYKKDGWYYILIAEGGCFADHHSIMARSQSIWGPFEPNPANPVLPKADLNGYIQYTSHGDLFQHPSGQWYFVCLGVRKSNGRFVMGRESVLTTATWPCGEYPIIHSVPVEVPIPYQDSSWSMFNPESKIGAPDVACLFIRDPDFSKYEFDKESMILSASKADVSQCEEPVTFVGKRQRLLDGSASVALDCSALSPDSHRALQAGLCYYKDEHRYIRVFVDFNSFQIIFQIVNTARSIRRRRTRFLDRTSAGQKMTLGIDYTENTLSFWYSSGDKAAPKSAIEDVDTLDISGHDFVGPVIGIFAVGNEEEKAHFSNLVVA
jgi:beta-xylosidase